MNINDVRREPQPAVKKLIRLEILTIVYLMTSIAVLMLTMGNSQAMKTAWVDDVLSLIPPATVLITDRIRKRKANKEFPNGYNRIISIGFLIAATALALMGVYLLIDSTVKLIEAERPSIGTIHLFGQTIWVGWLMILASLYSGFPAAILGHFKQPLALEIHNKVAYADTSMDRADWLVAAATVIGILGVGLGWWWADAAAAIFISLEVTRDGVGDIRAAISDLIDQTPTTLANQDDDPIIDRVNNYFKSLEWAQKSIVNLREDGDLFVGDAYVVPKEENRLVDRIDAAIRDLRRMDWRIKSMTITPVRQSEFELHQV